MSQSSVSRMKSAATCIETYESSMKIYMLTVAFYMYSSVIYHEIIELCTDKILLMFKAVTGIFDECSVHGRISLRW
jgi:hypothetical protein